MTETKAKKLVLPEQTVLLTPSSIKAFRLEVCPELVFLYAEGEAAGVNDIRWTELFWYILPPIGPPVFAVVGDAVPIPLIFPYQKWGMFFYPQELDSLTVVTTEGEVGVSIEFIPEHENNSHLKTALLLPNSNAVMGIAPNSTDFQTAFNSAAQQLQSKFPGRTNGQVTRSGFVAAGLPIGIAFTYVIMEQMS